jgi:hypothetical protein
MMKFDNKVSCVVSECADAKACAIVVSHTMFAIGAKRQDYLGEDLLDQNMLSHGQLCKYPISILQGGPDDLLRLAMDDRGARVSRVIFCESAISIWTDEELVEYLSTRTTEGTALLGVGLAGASNQIQKLTGGLKLFRF